MNVYVLRVQGVLNVSEQAMHTLVASEIWMTHLFYNFHIYYRNLSSYHWFLVTPCVILEFGHV